MLVEQFLSQIANVGALIVMGLELHGQPQELLVANLDGFSQQRNLAASVVVVVFHGDAVAAGPHGPGQRVAHYAATCASDGNGAGGIGANALNLHLLARTNRRLPESLSLVQDHLHHALQPGHRQMEVDETWR